MAPSFCRAPAAILCIFLLAAAPLSGAPPSPAGTAAARPNVILILADDLGGTDLGCYGSDFYQTPHLDQLARDGLRFTRAYSACTVCSPTRAAVLTGKYPARLRVTDWIPGLPPANPKLLVPDWTKHLPAGESTIARVLHEAGYATASIGKWHLGDEAYYPPRFGFDVNIAGTAAPAPSSYFAPWKIATLSEGREGDYLTDRLGDEAVRFIERHRAAPFFLYLAHFAVHTPIQGRADPVARHRARPPGTRHRNAAYAAMLESLDATVGRIRATLEELRLSERTILLFTSDNGGRIPTTSNLPFRAGKGSCYEGGVRVPLLLHWPGVTRPGSISDAPAMSIDLYPTVLEMTGLRGPTGHRPDGESLVPLVRGSGTLQRDALFWHYPHYQHYQQGGTTPYGAVRAEEHKLVEFYDDFRVELYDLRADPGEQKNLAAAQPERVQQLRERLHRWRAEVGAQMPTRNPAHDPSKPEHTPMPKKAAK